MGCYLSLHIKLILFEKKVTICIQMLEYGDSVNFIKLMLRSNMTINNLYHILKPMHLKRIFRYAYT